MGELSVHVLRRGSADPPPEGRPLRAGPLSLLYEPGGLRYISLGDREVIRRVYFAVRDRNWRTAPTVLSGLQLDAGEDSFHIAFNADSRLGDIRFAWAGAIAGEPDGTITFSADGRAESSFLSNRIGFCVLHPVAECAGRLCRIEHVDGTVTEGTFPHHVEPRQPFLDVRAISHEVQPSVRAEVRLEGDAFETEDQRNWTDASYKTYSRPLRLPFPFRVAQGDRVCQSVGLSLKAAALRAARRVVGPGADGRVVLTVGKEAGGPLPRLGLGVASHGEPLREEEAALLRELRLCHLRVDLDLGRPGCEAALREASRQAGALGTALEAALFLADAPAEELEALAALVADIGAPVCTWLVFPRAGPASTAALVQAARGSLSGHNPDAKFGGGTNGNFAELNRNRPAFNAFDVVSYSLNPQVHAFDDVSLVESLDGQRWTIESARGFLGDRPLAISPVTLRPRLNPAATALEREAPEGLPAQVDPRQMSLFGAAWTAGSLKRAFEGRLYSATYYETTGWRGVMETQSGSPMPGRFPSLPGSVFPLYHVFAEVAEFRGGVFRPLTSSHPLLVDGLAMQKDGRTRMLVANLSAEPQRVMAANLSGQATVRLLDETNAEAAMRHPWQYRSDAGKGVQTGCGALELNLLPYAVACVDVAEEQGP